MRLFADHEYPLTEVLEQWSDFLQRRARARREHEQLPLSREIRVPEHRCGDIILAMTRMLLGDAAGNRRADRARRNMDRIWREDGRQTLGTERDRGKRVVVGEGSHHHIAGGKIGKVLGSASARQSRCSLRVSVIGDHLMTVFNQIEGKSVPHMAETSHADTSDSKTSGRLSLEFIGHVDLLPVSVVGTAGRLCDRKHRERAHALGAVDQHTFDIRGRGRADVQRGNVKLSLKAASSEAGEWSSNIGIAGSGRSTRGNFF